MSGVEAALIEAARFERDRRSQTYPQKIYDGKIDAEPAAIDFQCWVAIAEWLDTGRFFSFAGGAEPERADAPIISWAELESAAEAALVSVSAQCDRLFTAEQVEAGAYEEACARRSRLWAIHRKVQLRRQMVDSINREFRSTKQGEVAA